MSLRRGRNREGRRRRQENDRKCSGIKFEEVEVNARVKVFVLAAD